MKHLFNRYEIALKLKGKGFSEPCFGGYANSGELKLTRVDFQSDLEGYCLAPLYQQVIDWFIGKDIFIEIYCNASGYGYILTKTNGTTIKEIEDDIFFDSYYKALEKGIEEALKLI